VFIAWTAWMQGWHESREMKRVLLIEDDRDIVELVRYNLEREGFQVAAANDGATGLVQVRKTRRTCCCSRSDAAKAFRSRNLQGHPARPGAESPADSDADRPRREADRVVGLEMARTTSHKAIQSARAGGARQSAAAPRRAAGRDAARGRDTWVEDRPVFLPRDATMASRWRSRPLEFRLLYYLATRPNRVFTRDQLLDAVWAPSGLSRRAAWMFTFAGCAKKSKATPIIPRF